MRNERSAWSELARHATQLVLPSLCLACGQPTSEWRPHLGLCVPCRSRLTRPGGACPRCGEPIAGAGIPAGYACGECRLRPPAFDRLIAAWLYRPPLDSVVQHLKYRRLAYLGNHLAAALAEAAPDVLGQADQVVPVPLHWSRQLLRGFNQAAEIAHPLARRLGLPLCSALRRTHRTAPQASLPRERRISNPERAFRPTRRSRLAGRTVLLVDDVMTTGATLDAAARALKKAGACCVLVAIAGRTPPPGLASPGGLGRVLEPTRD